MLRPLLLAIILPATALAAAATPAKTASMQFEVKTPKLTQQLNIVRTTEKAVSFEFTISGDCQRTVTGEARLRGGPPRIQKDEKGRSYPADEFVYLTETCGLVLRIKAKDSRLATVAQAGSCAEVCRPLPDIMFRAASAGASQKRPGKSPADR
jgi:hypothetical protein